jgi:polysaccharide pyruvyl transferase WcaK-like protein
MVIGLLGLAFGSNNKGCEALGYGFLTILQKIAINRKEKFEIFIFQKCDVNKIYNNGVYSELNLLSFCELGVKKHRDRREHIARYKKCDIIFDFTAGDSFSDIYGIKRFFQRTIVKHIAICSGTPLVLGSQTYGPYKTWFARKYASIIMKGSSAIFARDKISATLVKKLTNIDVKQTLDIAFAMQHESKDLKSDKIRLGINPSGLLWNGGYTGNNQFGLCVDYKKYCQDLIDKLLKLNLFDITLVPHVISDDMEQSDNDIIACKLLIKQFPELNLSPMFDTPMEAKSYISSFDVFTGARMHATIAAISTGVAVIPFSYSAKFEGVFGGLGYNYLISGQLETTESAVDKSVSYIREWEMVKKHVDSIMPVIIKGVEKLIQDMDSVLPKKYE